MRAWVVLVSFILMTLSARAELHKVQIKNFSGQFQNESGSATADRFEFPTKDLTAFKIRMSVERYGDGYRFVYGSEEFVWENPPAFVSDVETLRWSGISVTGKVGGIVLKVPSIETTATKGGGTLKGLNANCGNHAFQILSFGEELLTNCIKKSVLTLKSFKGNKQEGEKKSIDVDDVKVTIRNGKLVVEAKVEVGTKMKVKAEGSISYNRSAKQIKVKIDKVKAGVLNVTGKVFKELKKIESDKVKVNRPYITITMN